MVESGANEESASVESTPAREVYDITGAGDMVIAVAALCQARGWPLKETARLANAAAALEIEQLGVAPVTWDQISERLPRVMLAGAESSMPRPDRDQTSDSLARVTLAGAESSMPRLVCDQISERLAGVTGHSADRAARPEALRRAWSSTGHPTDVHCNSHSDRPDVPRNRSAEKVVTLPELAQCVAVYRTDGKTIVFTNGCFDLLHVGHVTFLQDAARLGDVLIVAINSDSGVRRLKGPSRPVISQADRAAMLASLACVDHVLIFDEETPHRLLDWLRPDILVKGGTTTEVVGREVVEAYGGKVCTTDIVGASSTTKIVESIKQTNQLRERNRAVNA